MSIRRMRLGLLAHLRMGAVISALVSGYAHVGHAQSFSHFYVFGGSFSDAGTYLRGTTAADAVSRRWTVNPAPVWNQLLGQEHGIAVTPYLAINTVDGSSTVLGGSN
jgi:outer membrane lipase/esterase